MKARPQKPFKPLTGYIGDFENVPQSIDLIKVLVKQALFQNLWLYEPDSKRWFSPEEFLEMYDRYDNLPIKWIESIEVRDPMEGLNAADQQIQSIAERRAIFEQRIIDYWRHKAVRSG